METEHPGFESQGARAGWEVLIVTGDKAMLRLGRFQGVEILSLRAFLSRLESLE